MTVEAAPLCAQCANRLARHSDPEVPRLLEGYCPQCGGNEPFEPDDATIRPPAIPAIGAVLAR